MATMLEKDLEVILEDNTSGSSELLSKLNDWFIKYYAQKLPDQSLIDQLLDDFSTFETITLYLRSLKAAIKTSTSNSLTEYFLIQKKEFDSAFNNLSVNAIDLLSPCNNIVTISNSGQIYKILREYFKLNCSLQVSVCESRPKFEGRILASKLADLGIKTSLITEAMIAEFVQNCDCVITGADKILSNGSVVNKVGSRLLAITAKYYNKPFYVFADKSKLSNNSNYNHRNFPESEICDCNNNIIINNYYFETIDMNLLAKVVTN